MPRLIVSGATGYIARHTVAELLASGVTPGELILVTRTPEALGEWAGRGAAVRRGDFGVPEHLPEAFAGGDRLVLISPAPESFATTEDQLTAQCAAIDAARQAGVSRVVLQSRLTAHPDLGGADREAAATEAALRSSGLEWTMLRTASFADSRGRDARRYLRDGFIATNADPDVPVRAVTRTDIAAAAAATLVGGQHAGQTYHVLGPGVSVAQLAGLLSEVSGRSIEVRQMDDAAFVEAMVERGRLRRIAEMAVVAGRQARELSLRLTCDLPGLIGRPGQSLLDFLREHRLELLTGSPPPGAEPVLT